MYVQSVLSVIDVLTYATAQRIQDSAKKPAPATGAPTKRLRGSRNRSTPQLDNRDMQWGMEGGTAALPSSKTEKAVAFSGPGIEGTPKVIVVSLSYTFPMHWADLAYLHTAEGCTSIPSRR
jgi:hypothetical protein